MYIKSADHTLSESKNYLIILSITLCIIVGMLYHLLMIIALIGCIILLVTSDENQYVSFLFFLMPISYIFKLSADTTSFFTFVEMAFIIYHFYKERGGLKKEHVLALVLFGYVLLCECFTNSVDITRTLKLLINLLLLCILVSVDYQKNINSIFISYILGIILSGLLGRFGSNFLPVDQYIKPMVERISQDENIYRFAGLYTDPNYYSVNLLISACLTIFLYHKKWINGLAFIILLVIIIYMTGNTGSKSAFLMLILPALVYNWLLIKNKRYKRVVLFCIVVFGFAYLVFQGSIPIFNNALERLSASKEGGINRITTGRYDLWISYINHLKEHPLNIVFGNGVGNYLLYGKGAHNTYIDFIYQLGLIGTAIYIWVLSIISRSGSGFRTDISNYAVWICILIMYFFLSQLQSFDLPFQLALAMYCLNLDFSPIKGENTIGVKRTYKYIL